ncbi:phage tail assembly protein [Paenibacillus sp. 2TAB19]|uniref:phage tail assembly protein n=1 Tax=Paenibacillus sp. 2TAB19 TaxID=3233003 RepID=UPI003F9CFAD5
MEIYTLQKPINDGDETITELELDFDNMDAEDILAADRQYNVQAAKNNDFAPIKELAKPYLALIVAKAAKQPVEVIYKLKAKDFSKVTMLAQNFLLG